MHAVCDICLVWLFWHRILAVFCNEVSCLFGLAKHAYSANHSAAKA